MNNIIPSAVNINGLQDVTYSHDSIEEFTCVLYWRHIMRFVRNTLYICIHGWKQVCNLVHFQVSNEESLKLCTNEELGRKSAPEHNLRLRSFET